MPIFMRYDEELKGEALDEPSALYHRKLGIHFRMISTNSSITSLTFSVLRLPTRYKTRLLSAVNMRLGLTLLGCFKLPVSKSLSLIWIAYLSLTLWLVIWQRIKSSPSNPVITRAGRLLAYVRSENGKGITTTSPLTNSAKHHPPLASANPFLKRIRWR